MPKADKKSGKDGKKKKQGGSAPAVSAPPEAPDEGGHSLADLARRLGPPDRELEKAVRSGHPDDALQREGARVASERILEDGPRLCSKGFTHLESTDPDVQLAARKTGLTRPMLALTVDVLQRLAVNAGAMSTERGKRSDRRQVTTLTIETATSEGRALKRHVIDRLRVLQGVDPAIAATVDRAFERSEKPRQLVDQLTLLAGVVASLPTHPSTAVRALAAAKGFDASDATELTQAADAIKQASSRSAGGASAQQEEKQAVLDVLDGLCLVLIDDLVRTLRAMARLTPKVRKPVLFGLASYFGARGKADDEPHAPAPTPA